MPDKLYNKTKDDFTLVIEGREVVVESAKFMRSMDTCADAFTAVIPWEPGRDPELDRITAPYSYSKCKIYIGGNLESEQILYNVSPKSDQGGRVKELGGFSKTADIIDSTVLPPYEANNISLTDRCKQQCEPHGIQVVIGDGVNLMRPRVVSTGKWVPAKTRQLMPVGIITANGFINTLPLMEKSVTTKGYYKITGKKTIYEEMKFARVSAEQTDTIYNHLKKLAALRGLLLSCTWDGNLLITRANTDDKPIGTIEESEPTTDQYSAEFNGRQRWHFYRAIATSSRRRRTAKTGVTVDPAVQNQRYLTFRADESIPGEALNSAECRRNKSAADAMTISFPASTWRGPDGKLWIPNTQVSVVSPTIGLKSGYSLLITQVEFTYEKTGNRATLNLKPPSVYSHGVIDEPWLNEISTGAGAAPTQGVSA